MRNHATRLLVGVTMLGLATLAVGADDRANPTSRYVPASKNGSKTIPPPLGPYGVPSNYPGYVGYDFSGYVPLAFSSEAQVNWRKPMPGAAGTRGSLIPQGQGKPPSMNFSTRPRVAPNGQNRSGNLR